MPQIANTHTLPEWENGYLLAGVLKTTSGTATLYISGDWSEATCPSGLCILCNCRDSGTFAVAMADVGSYSSSTRLTLITFKLFDEAGLAITTSDLLIDYMIWVNDTESKTYPLVGSVTIKLK